MAGAALAAIAVPPAAGVLAGDDTATCAGKRRWQRSVVDRAIAEWFASQPRSESLLELVQAEQGIAACAAGVVRLGRLHTTNLTPGLTLEQLGAVLLANELEWRGLVPAPATGLAGEIFRVSPGVAARGR